MVDLGQLGFRVERALGEGAYAEVFAARDPSGAAVVVKVARGERRDGAGVTQGMFFAEGVALATGSLSVSHPTPDEVVAAEAQALRRIDHPAFPRLLAHGRVRHGGRERAYLVLRASPGVTWREALLRGAPPLRVAHVRDLSDALADVRERGELAWHGDVKPENLLVDDAGRVTVLDPSSGLTELDEHGGLRRIVCTPLYDPLLACSDVPALGLLLVEVATGTQPLAAAPSAGPERPAGPKLRAWIAARTATGGGDLLRGLLRMRLPSELRPGLDPRIEAAALRCLGLRGAGGGLEATDAFGGPREVAEALRPLA